MTLGTGVPGPRRPPGLRFRAGQALLVVIYFLLLTGLYLWAIGPIWSYLPVVVTVDGMKILACCILVASLAGFLSCARPSQFYFTLCVLLILIPSLVLYVSTEGLGTFLLMTLLAFATLAATLALPPLLLPSVSIRLSSAGIAIGLLFLSATILLAVILKGGLGNFNLDPLAVYDFRDQANQTLQGGLAYIVPLATNIAIPLALLIAVAQRLRLLVVACLGIAVLFYGFVTLKSYVVYPLIVAGAYVVLGSRRPTRLVLWALVGVVVLSSLECWLYLREEIAGNWFTVFTTRRMLMIPSIVNAFYVDHFLSNPYYYWATSKLTLGLVEPPSSMDIADLVGWNYLNEGSHANTGWIGSGYAQAGAIGVFVYSALLGLILKYLDGCAAQSSARLVSALFLVPLLTMITSSDSVSVFLTQGLLFAIVLFPAIARGLGKQERMPVLRLRRPAYSGHPSGIQHTRA